MNSRETGIPGVLIIEPNVFGDERGWFMESYQRERYAELSLPADFVQDNLAFSSIGIPPIEVGFSKPGIHLYRFGVIGDG